MPPWIFPRAAEGDNEEGAHERTRVDDSDPTISFSPGPSPYQSESSPWVSIRASSAWKGTAVMTDKLDAQLSFSFPGDSLTIALLYRGDGTNAKLTLENGTSYPLQVTAAEATATAPNGDKQELQKKLFHLNGLSCTNHTATLSRDANDLPGTGNEVQFDWYSFVTPDSAASCTATGLPSSSSGSTSPSVTSSSSPADSGANILHHTNLYAGISIGAALGGFLLAFFAILCYRRSRRRSRTPPAELQPDRAFRPRRAHTISDDTLSSMPLAMSQRTSSSGKPLILEQPNSHAYVPRGMHALAHDESFSSSKTAEYYRQSHSIIDSPSANAAFPLMPMSPAAGEGGLGRVDDVGFNIGRTLLELKHDRNVSSPPIPMPREVRYSDSKPHSQSGQDEKARTLSSTPLRLNHDSPSLTGGHALQRLPREIPPFAKPKPRTANGPKKTATPAKSPRRPTTASAVDRLKAEARQLAVHRPLSPFNRSRPTTSAETPSHSHTHALTHSASTSTNASTTNRFHRRRNSTSSIDTSWSLASADSSANANAPAVSNIGNAFWSKSMLDVPSIPTQGEEVKEKEATKTTTTDSEAEMWVSKSAQRKLTRRRYSSSGVLGAPKRPPKSPHRPSTGQQPPPAMSFQPFTIG